MSSESGDHGSLGQMPPNELKKRIIEFLKENNMFVLATYSNDMPRATPIAYRSKGITMYFVGEPGIKLENIKNNPKVSVGIFSPYIGWNSAKGAQITGNAKLISRENSGEFKEGLETYQWEKTAKKLGLKTFPKTGVELVRVEPEKIEYVDMSLKKIGYSPRQTLLCNSAF